MFFKSLAAAAFSALLLASSPVRAGEIAIDLIKGTYNVTWITLHGLPTSSVAALLPSQYKLVDPAAATSTVIFELGREINTGVAGIATSFQEAKLQVPGVQRVSGKSTPFLYKKSIWVDSALQSVGSLLVYGLNATTQSFSPADSGPAAQTYSYAVNGVVSATLAPAANQSQSTAEAFAYAALPWFGSSGLLCSRHRYDSANLVQQPVYLEGTVDVLEGNSIKGSYKATAVHLTSTFGILLPQDCHNFV
ncbi:hypothetical protein DFJ73DRAFT_825066 [Zopfochytrium polystomum]|nr:hypothetical protein DFJ73DRAFT_825066 [Zopfochytrium polystomum]